MFAAGQRLPDCAELLGGQRRLDAADSAAGLATSDPPSTASAGVANEADAAAEPARCAFCSEAAASGEPLARPCGCHAPPGGVHLACLLAAAERRPRWWADFTCPGCGWWYVGRSALPLALAAVEAAERQAGAWDVEVAFALLALSRVLRGAEVSAAAGGRQQALEQRRQVLERALAIPERACGSEHPRLAATLEELGEVSGALGDLGQRAALAGRALRLEAERGGAEAARRARVLHRLAEALRRHNARPESCEALAEARRGLDAHGEASAEEAGKLLKEWRAEDEQVDGPLPHRVKRRRDVCELASVMPQAT